MSVHHTLQQHCGYRLLCQMVIKAIHSFVMCTAESCDHRGMDDMQHITPGSTHWTDHWHEAVLSVYLPQQIAACFGCGLHSLFLHWNAHLAIQGISCTGIEQQYSAVFLLPVVRDDNVWVLFLRDSGQWDSQDPGSVGTAQDASIVAAGCVQWIWRLWYTAAGVQHDTELRSLSLITWLYHHLDILSGVKWTICDYSLC